MLLRPEFFEMFEPVFSGLDEANRNEAVCASELDRTEQSSWILVLKYLDDLEREHAQKAADQKQI